MSGGIKVVYGTSALSLAPMTDARKYLEICERHGVRELDTARRYGESEVKLAQLGAPKKFIIQTKAPGGPGMQTREILLDVQKLSFSFLKTDKVWPTVSRALRGGGSSPHQRQHS